MKSRSFLFTLIMASLFAMPAQATNKYDKLIANATLKYQADHYPEFVVWHKARIKCESDFNAYAVSPVGAEGLAQFMPGTSTEYRIDAFNPNESIPGMVRYTNDIAKFIQIERVHERGSTEAQQYIDAAYNTGMGRVRRLARTYSYSWNVIYWKLPLETRNYVTRIQKWKRIYAIDNNSAG